MIRDDCMPLSYDLHHIHDDGGDENDGNRARWKDDEAKQLKKQSVFCVQILGRHCIDRARKKRVYEDELYIYVRHSRDFFQTVY